MSSSLGRANAAMATPGACLVRWLRRSGSPLYRHCLPYLRRIEARSDFIGFASGGTEAEGVRLDLGSRGRFAGLLALALACAHTHSEEERYFGRSSELCVCIVELELRV